MQQVYSIQRFRIVIKKDDKCPQRSFRVDHACLIRGRKQDKRVLMILQASSISEIYEGHKITVCLFFGPFRYLFENLRRHSKLFHLCIKIKMYDHLTKNNPCLAHPELGCCPESDWQRWWFINWPIMSEIRQLLRILDDFSLLWEWPLTVLTFSQQILCHKIDCFVTEWQVLSTCNSHVVAIYFQ